MYKRQPLRNHLALQCWPSPSRQELYAHAYIPRILCSYWEWPINKEMVTITIDCYGDHLLGCGQGPLRIKRHDSIRDIIWQSLILDNPQTSKEQRCDSSNSRPGDILHPDFILGKPAFFDVSVRNSFIPSLYCRFCFASRLSWDCRGIGKRFSLSGNSRITRGSFLSAGGRILWPLDGSQYQTSEIHRW